MKIEYMEYFLEAARCQSISAAAKKLYMSQSSLSSIIQSVEADLGCPLFRRTTRGIVLTDSGEEALALMQEICTKYNALQHLAPNSESQRKKNICVCIYPCLSSYLSVSISAKLQEECYKNVILSIQGTPESKTLARILDGTADIAIGLCKESELIIYRQALERTDFTIEVLFSDEPCCYVNKNSRFANREFIHANELKSEHLATAQSCLETHDFNVMNRITTQIAVFNNIETVLQTIATNNFIAIIPSHALINDSHVLDGSIKRVPMTGMETQFVSFIIYNKQVSRSKIEQIVVNDIKEILKRHAV